MRLLPEVPTRAALNRRHGERFKWLALLVVGLGKFMQARGAKQEAAA